MNNGMGQAGEILQISWWRRFGGRNWAYLAFVVLLVPFGIILGMLLPEELTVS